jgi:putative hemolysin
MKPLILAVLFSMLVACASHPDAPATPGAAGMANPASVYCQQRGGKLEIVKDRDGGEVGYCSLPGGERIEEWALFRRDHK